MPKADFIKIGVVDDHRLFRKGLISLIEMIDSNYSILFEADNGVELQRKIDSNNPPDIILLDINMPDMNGFDSVEWLNEYHPLVKVLIVSMVEKEETIVQMLKLGVKGYLCKDVEPQDLQNALQEVYNKGFYYTDFITGKLVHSLQINNSATKDSSDFSKLKEREQEFLQFACSEMTYSEIADKMFLSPKTIDGYRNSLFEKLNVRNRVGLAMHAVRHGWVTL